MSDTLEEDEDTIRGIVKQLKGKENQEYMEYLFLNLFKKELSFVDTKKAPPFNKEKSEIQIQNYKENEHLAHQTKVKKALFKTLAAFELLASAIICLSLAGISFFAFRRHSYFLGVPACASQQPRKAESTLGGTRPPTRQEQTIMPTA